MGSTNKRLGFKVGLPEPRKRNPFDAEDKFVIESLHRTSIAYTTKEGISELNAAIDIFAGKYHGDVLVEHSPGSPYDINQVSTVYIESPAFARTKSCASQVVKLIRKFRGELVTGWTHG